MQTEESIPVFDRWERHVMGRLGIQDKDEQRNLRNRLLREGEDYCIAKKRVMYSSQGAAKISDFLRGKARGEQPDQNGFPQKNAAPGSNTEEIPPAKKARLMEVSRPGAQIRNRRVIECLLADDPDRRNIQIVRVIDNSNFVPGTKTGRILAIHVHGNIWDFAGNPESAPGSHPRCPRWRGKW